jgi:hypothetical protein
LELNAARDSKKEEWELMKRTDAMKHLNEIKVGVGISRSQLLNISDFLDEMTTDCLQFINTKRNYLKNSDTEIVNYYKHIQSFSSAYDGLKQKLNAESDESKFFKLLIENFSTKMTFIVKNFLLIFDIYSKGLKRRPKLGDIVLNVRQKISNSWNTIVNVENDVRKLKSELLEASLMIKSVPEEFSEGHNDVEENIFKESLLTQDMNLKLLMTVTLEGFRDLEGQLAGFLKDFMMEHEKIFSEMHEHGLILESLLDVVDEAETEALDTLHKDPNIKKLISKEVEINNSNHIVFEPTANLSRGSQIIAHASQEWYQVFSRYFRDAEIFGPLAERQGSASDKEQVLSILNITKSEYLATRKYDCRLTKNKIPYSGEVILVKDVFCVLATGSLIGIDSLVFWVPFSEIFELVSKNSFMGLTKGIFFGFSKQK